MITERISPSTNTDNSVATQVITKQVLARYLSITIAVLFELIRRMIYKETDVMPYYRRILAKRRRHGSITD